MRTRRVRERVCVAVAICAAACACAVQAADTVVVPAQEVSAFDCALCGTTVFGNTSESRLADIGRQVLDPVHYSHPLSDSANTQARTLPAVPAAVFMTLFGFFCVSMTRDRRMWLALAGGLIWLGQAGVETVPHLAHRIRARTIGQSAASLRLAFSPAMGVQPTGCDEEISYAGLLHKLAGIPDHVVTFHSHTSANAGASGLATGGPRAASVLAPARLWQDTAYECPAGATGHIIRFSPAFEFCNLARGPPVVFL